MSLATQRIEAHGLHVISWDINTEALFTLNFRGYSTWTDKLTQDTLYAVSADDAAAGRPTHEQQQACEWWPSAELAAATYKIVEAA